MCLNGWSWILTDSLFIFAHEQKNSTTNFFRGVTSRSTFHAGQQRATQDQQSSAYNDPSASPSLSHSNSQVRRPGTGIFTKFTTKFVRRWVYDPSSWWRCYLRELLGINMHAFSWLSPVLPSFRMRWFGLALFFIAKIMNSQTKGCWSKDGFKCERC